MRPSVESLRIFEMCVSVGSFAGAADRLALTPAAVSLRIRSLEAELGQPLFTRAGRRVVPTAAAVALACEVRNALDHLNNALDAFRAGTTPLRVTAPPTFASRWLAPRLSGYRAAGGASIELDISSDVRDPTAFDVAIRTGRGGWDGLDEYPLMPVDVTPMVAPNLLGSRTLAAPEDLANFDLLPHPDWAKWFARAERSMPGGLRFASVDYSIFELIANAAVGGLGVALLSPTLFRSLLEDRLLVAPLATVLKGPDWYFALIREGDQRPAARSFCDWLREEVQRSQD
ncbi:LysR substrate-binding domain-containing protein [Nitratireductor sp. ZSWI3]|uniref:LysR substrate-binding domain-containing protein n=1 Tax=Nitratireductor sp. ZSWI3 TaxID=2966359 RepID=UPI0021505D31|nr:LysR substrate-binding domain-containing protein [Nitratireductor sp. ZSWI3]MCR4264765.1 LysR substrate-binding domain-containing protein [Nitratireductor sp. ZSWI3]